MKNAFSLLEILIVMTIIALLIAVGVAGLVSFRENTEAEQSTSEILAYLKETQTKAKNNSIPFNHNTSVTDFTASKNRNYAFFISTATVDGKLILQRRICWKSINPPTSWNALNVANCTSPENLVSSRFGNIRIMNAGGYGNPIRPACPLDFPLNAIIFENLTGKIISKASPSTSVSCRFAINIINQNINYSFIDFYFNNFTRAYN